MTINGQSGGILPVLVFGAGTDYALLLVSRYREELRRHEDKHEAMRVALRTAGPAILASGLTVILALLTLSLAEVNGTAGLGPIGAMGVGHRDDLDAHHAARAARHLRAQGVLVAVPRHDPARRPAGHGRDPRPLAQHRRVGGGAVAARVDRRDAAAGPARAQRHADRHRPDQQQLLPRRRRVGRGRRDPRALVPERARRAHQRDRPRRLEGARGAARAARAARPRRPGAAAAGGPARRPARRRPAQGPLRDGDVRPDPRAAPGRQAPRAGPTCSSAGRPRRPTTTASRRRATTS